MYVHIYKYKIVKVIDYYDVNCISIYWDHIIMIILHTHILDNVR